MPNARDLAYEVRAFYDQHGRYPRRGSSDRLESSLGAWLSNSRSRAKAGRMTHVAVSQLDDILPNWRVTPTEESFHRSVEALSAFISDNGRMPVASAADPSERSLGSWVGKARCEYKAGRLSDDRIRALNRSVPLWHYTPRDGLTDEAWHAQLADTLLLIEQRALSTVVDKRVDKWVQSQHEAWRNGELSEARTRAMDAYIDHWRRSASQRRWFTKLDRATSALRETGSIPRDDNGPYRLVSKWIKTQVAERNFLPPELIKALDAHLPGWSQSAFDDRWDAMFHIAAKFYDRHQCAPALKEGNPLSQWWFNQRRMDADGALDESRRVILDERMPLWRTTATERKWEKFLSDTEAFIRENGRTPRERSSVRSESALAVSSKGHRSSYRKGTMTMGRLRQVIERCPQVLDITAPQWLLDFTGDPETPVAEVRPEQPAVRPRAKKVHSTRSPQTASRYEEPNWQQRALDKRDAAWPNDMNSYAQFIETHGRAPSVSSRVREERLCARWIVQQRIDARSGTLSAARIAVLNERCGGWLDNKVQAA